MTKLHIGCGLRHLEGYINIDISPEVKPDVVADICKLPYADGSVDEIYTAHTLEHVPDFTQAMREMHRVLRPGGLLKITVPYAMAPAAFVPQHIWYFSWSSFNTFIKDTPGNYYYDFHFSSLKQRIKFIYWNRIISPLANWIPWLYQNTFLVYLFPGYEFQVEMIK